VTHLRALGSQSAYTSKSLVRKKERKKERKRPVKKERNKYTGQKDRKELVDLGTRRFLCSKACASTVSHQSKYQTTTLYQQNNNSTGNIIYYQYANNNKRYDETPDEDKTEETDKTR
jgi:hypothetical protein